MEKARMYLEANREALEEYRRLCNTIRCDYEEKNAYVYSRNERKKLEMGTGSWRNLVMRRL